MRVQYLKHLWKCVKLNYTVLFLSNKRLCVIVNKWGTKATPEEERWGKHRKLRVRNAGHNTLSHTSSSCTAVCFRKSITSSLSLPRLCLSLSCSQKYPVYEAFSCFIFVFYLFALSHCFLYFFIANKRQITGCWVQGHRTVMTVADKHQPLCLPNKIHMTHGLHPSSKPTRKPVRGPAALLSKRSNPWVYCLSSHLSPPFVVNTTHLANEAHWLAAHTHTHTHTQTNITFVISLHSLIPSHSGSPAFINTHCTEQAWGTTRVPAFVCTNNCPHSLTLSHPLRHQSHANSDENISLLLGYFYQESVWNNERGAKRHIKKNVSVATNDILFSINAALLKSLRTLYSKT